MESLRQSYTSIIGAKSLDEAQDIGLSDLFKKTMDILISKNYGAQEAEEIATNKVRRFILDTVDEVHDDAKAQQLLISISPNFNDKNAQALVGDLPVNPRHIKKGKDNNLILSIIIVTFVMFLLFMAFSACGYMWEPQIANSRAPKWAKNQWAP